MICSYCSTTLPGGAMFCGECGRAIATPTSPVQARTPSPTAEPTTQREPAGTCGQCGAPLEHDDIFCGECGFVVGTATGHIVRPTNTTWTFPVERAELAEPAKSAEPVEPAESPEPAEPVEPAESPEPAESSEPVEPAESPEPVQIIHHPVRGERFILQFSTGESFTVFGSGLIGRNPRAEPGEYFDQLVRVLDPSRSMSKTHLEFGQEAGSFWIKDRFSGNGTIFREPESAAVRCHPERRYRLTRGSRVDMGEQFFILS